MANWFNGFPGFDFPNNFGRAKQKVAEKFTIPDTPAGRFYRQNSLTIWIEMAVILGVAIGFAMRYAEFSVLQQYYWAFPGEVIMMNVLKCLVVPIVVLAITTSVASLGGASRKLTILSLVYVLGTTFLGVIVAIMVAYVVQPDGGFHPVGQPLEDQTIADGLLDIVRNCFPPNLISAMFQQVKSGREGNGTDETVGVEYSGPQPGENVLGLIVFCGFFGYYLGQLARAGNDAARDALHLINGLNDATMEMINLIMYYVPVGLIFLLSKDIMTVKDSDVPDWDMLGLFLAANLISLGIHALLMLPAVYFAVTNRNPYLFLVEVSQALFTSFGNGSSRASMPVTLRNLEQVALVDKRITRFFVPLGATINMDGTAIYQVITVFFVAALNGVTLGVGQVVTLIVSAIFISLGAASVPAAGTVTLVVLLTTVGLPTVDIAWIYTVDWFLQRCRTAVNVWSDCCAAKVLEHVCEQDLEQKPEFITLSL